MSTTLPTNNDSEEYQEAQKRVKKIKKFYKELASWAGTSVALIGMNLFLSGNISWAKFPVFFWGIFIIAQLFEIIRLQRQDKEWEARQMRRQLGNSQSAGRPLTDPTHSTEPLEDYSEELLNQKDREIADLSEYRKLKRPWKEDDLV